MAPESKHLIVGTAGHVDHGKTTLIHALTGINTDRLKEEQERGLTIDLGFASLRLPSGRTVGIVDVPGHERFLKNMLAGASGVDIVLLVVAADEGVMPQTREHLDILELLESRQGVVALTKSDAVEDDWLEIVEDDLKEYLKDTFLRDARIVRVSGVTGEGIDTLRAEIDRLADAAEQRPPEGPFRLPIDRVFTMTGFGTVVTGTLVSGTVKVGDPARILPQTIDTRIRGIQVHGSKQESAQAGSRVAVNLAGVEVADIERGDVLLPPGHLQASTAIDASVRVLPDAPRSLANRTRVRLHIGTAEAIGRAAILGAREITPGQRGFVQLKLESPVVAARGDRFVLRFYSPMALLGGGIVLDPTAPKHRANEKNLTEKLQHKLKGDPLDIVQDALAVREAGMPAEELAKATTLPPAEVDAALQELLRSARVMQLGARFIHKGALEAAAARAVSLLSSYFLANPMKTAMPKEELRQQLSATLDSKGFQTLLSAFAQAGAVEVSDTAVNLPGRKPALVTKDQELVDAIEETYSRAGTNPPLLSDLEAAHGPRAKDATALLAERGTLVKIAPDLFFAKTAIEAAENVLINYLQSHEGITVAGFRDLVGSSRKYVVPILEYFDGKRLTRRVGDMRVLVK